MSIVYKLKRFIDFMRLLKVEIYVFITFFVSTLKLVPMNQLVQDKICLFKYKLNSTYCTDLSTMEDDYLHKKSDILADGTTYTMYYTIILTIPSVIATLFIGSWTDTYLKAKKILLIGGAIGCVLEMLVFILNDVMFDSTYYCVLLSIAPTLVTAGLLGQLSAIWSYIASTTPSHMRAIRMTMTEIVIGTGQPLGTYVAGLILNTDPWIKGKGQLHNYSASFALGGMCFIVALIFAIFFIDEKRDIKDWEKRFNAESDPEKDSIVSVDDRVHQKLKKFSDHKHIHPMKLLFNINNVKEMWRTCSKKRDKSVRRQIWLLFLADAIYLLEHVGPIIFMFQFSQKVYEWDSATYSNGSTIEKISQTVATMIFGAILLKVIKVNDMTLTMVGLGSYFSLNLIRGVVLSADGFYYSLIPGSLGGLAAVGIRSHFSKIIKPHELGKVFSSLACIETITPLFAAGLFILVFNATMDSMPSLCMYLMAFVLIIPFLVMVWIQFFTQLPDLSDNISESIDETNQQQSNGKGVVKTIDL